jgi:hypothetical protein
MWIFAPKPDLKIWAGKSVILPFRPAFFVAPKKPREKCTQKGGLRPLKCPKGLPKAQKGTPKAESSAKASRPQKAPGYQPPFPPF